MLITPEWNEHDFKICRQYDDKVRQGKMGYTRVRVE